jgi:HxlR-like helix-turn-helix
MASQWELSQDVIGLIGGRWTIDVLGELQRGGRRYQELNDALDGVSHKVLTDTLRRLERDGLAARLVDPSRVDTATSGRELPSVGAASSAPPGDQSRPRQCAIVAHAPTALLSG